MSLWKSLFGKSKSDEPKRVEKIKEQVPNEFRNWVKMSIQIIGNDLKNMENEELHNHLIKKGIPEFEAGEIIIFLPTAFCRKLLPQLNWLSEYYDYYSDKKQIKRKYRENQRYVIMEEETNNYWNQNPNNEEIIKIAGRSSEFDAINQMLNAGGKLENVKLTEAYVIRYE